MVRNHTLSIVKAIGIVAVCLGHANAPAVITTLVYTFHMPLFFIASGYFFSPKKTDDPWAYISGKVRSLWLPFVQWSLLFLLLHNVLFHIGLLNEQYGNAAGGTLHPYTWHQGVQRLFYILFSFAGYDEFLGGTFWFFRGLFFASIGFFLAYRFLGRYPRLSHVGKVGIIALTLWGIIALKVANNLSIITIVQGGIRELWGALFIAIGSLLRHKMDQLPAKVLRIPLCISILAVATYYHWQGMVLKPTMTTVLTLPLTGTAGFLLCYDLAEWLRSNATMERALSYVGDNSLIIFILHPLAFKAASMIKILAYGLDWAQIGCHMAIHAFADTDYFYLLYTAVGVALPLAIRALYRKAIRFSGNIHIRR